MPTEAVHGVRARCDECRWRGPLRQRYGEAVTDERRHVHRTNAALTLMAFLRVYGHASPYPVLLHHGAHAGAETDRPSQ